MKKYEDLNNKYVNLNEVEFDKKLLKKCHKLIEKSQKRPPKEVLYKTADHLSKKYEKYFKNK